MLNVIQVALVTDHGIKFQEIASYINSKRPIAQ